MNKTIITAISIIAVLIIQGIIYTLLGLKITTVDQIFVVVIIALFKLDDIRNNTNKKD
jgi:hypothetical protein